MSQHLKDKILIVDDETFYISVLVEILGDEYHVSIAKSGEQALDRIAKGFIPDLVLLDILMPGLDGYEVCKKLKDSPDTSNVPVIFLTVKNEVEEEILGFELGAADYIIKPFSLPVIRARVKTHLALSAANKALTEQNHTLEAKVIERTAEISRTQDVAIYCMASLAETRDNETGKHIRRTQYYVKALAEYLRLHSTYADQIDGDYIDILFKSAPLHDIGKVGVPDAILLKPGKLNSAEWEEMKKHAEYGKLAMENAEHEYGTSSYLNVAKEIAYGHHERWDGSGYPQGLMGINIPLSARIMALADCYDALISRRVYKAAFSHEKATEIIKQGSGSHFDPQIVEAFEVIEEQFMKIADHFRDDD
ncbi:two-component system response regulator [Vibrio sp. 10N.286.49.B3]|uniref:HD-GYP domain-containing protein n=1 Tax=Vibrio sp. 10N.286.49.B3 TaxID=1880855 RepID=UPI000C835FAC|nr:HD domain-containing phosphohydrolase [Vibrio sp. 10N.286.49.B3]PMH46564.1 two-component system response regulator [Vibrio sp. 10N.286.49.B3]